MRNVRTSFAPALAGYFLPLRTLEFFGSVNSATSLSLRSIHPRLRRHGFHFVRHRLHVHGAIVECRLALGIDAHQRVLHPVGVVTVREILARMRAAAFVALLG